MGQGVGGHHKNDQNQKTSGKISILKRKNEALEDKFPFHRGENV